MSWTICFLASSGRFLLFTKGWISILGLSLYSSGMSSTRTNTFSTSFKRSLLSWFLALWRMSIPNTSASLTAHVAVDMLQMTFWSSATSLNHAEMAWCFLDALLKNSSASWLLQMLFLQTKAIFIRLFLLL